MVSSPTIPRPCLAKPSVAAEDSPPRKRTVSSRLMRFWAHFHAGHPLRATNVPRHQQGPIVIRFLTARPECQAQQLGADLQPCVFGRFVIDLKTDFGALVNEIDH